MGNVLISSGVRVPPVDLSEAEYGFAKQVSGDLPRGKGLDCIQPYRRKK
jgi:hypothetical protein